MCKCLAIKTQKEDKTTRVCVGRPVQIQPSTARPRQCGQSLVLSERLDGRAASGCPASSAEMTKNKLP